MMRRVVVAALAVILAGVPGYAQQTDPPRARAQAEMPELPAPKAVRVNGAELAYVEQGQGEPVVLIHGFLHDFRLWSGQIAELSQRFRVIAYSMRYRWPSEPPAEGAELSPSANLRDLVALIQELKLGRVHLLGHSGGAGLALRVAREHPELVRSLVLGEPGPFAVEVDAAAAAPLFTPESASQVRLAFEGGDLERALQIVRDAVLGQDAPAQPMPKWVIQMLLDNAWQLELLWTRGEPERPLTCEDARRINVPTLLLGGDRSPAVFGLVLDKLEQCLPAAERAVLPDSSHGLELDNPAAFNETVLDFLDRQAER